MQIAKIAAWLHKYKGILHRGWKRVVVWLGQEKGGDETERKRL